MLPPALQKVGHARGWRNYDAHVGLVALTHIEITVVRQMGDNIAAQTRY
jgi:hypothetical protein